MSENQSPLELSDVSNARPLDPSAEHLETRKDDGKSEDSEQVAREQSESQGELRVGEAIARTEALADAADNSEGIAHVENAHAEDVAAQTSEVPNAEVSNSETMDSTLNQDSAERERELLSLIRDLNECNDALLAQVSTLENDLQQTKAIAQADIERAKAAQIAQETANRQILADQSSAQHVAQVAQQQIAKLISDLDIAEQTLSRQQILNENLRTELADSQDHVTHLEREYALLTKRHAEEVQAKVQAETKSRDLRSRLQRQQRYTLQFKAALEKSLTVGHSSAAPSVDPVRPVSFNQPTSVTMPRSQRIMPWAANSATTAFRGIDPHLEALIRRGNKPPIHASAQQTIQSETVQSEAVAPDIQTAHIEPSPEAETRLWQDLERVMTADDQPSEAPAESAQTETVDIDTDAIEISAEIATESADIETSLEATEGLEATGDIETTAPQEAIAAQALEGQAPAFNWQAESKQVSAPAETALAKETTASAKETTEGETADSEVALLDNQETIARETADQEELEQETSESEQATELNNIALADALAKVKRQSQLDASPTQSVAFTEPSPWISQTNLPETSEDEQVAVSAQSAASHNHVADYLPAVEAGRISTVSPVAQPLRTQKKVSSMASVKLPMFPKSASSHLKR